MKKKQFNDTLFAGIFDRNIQQGRTFRLETSGSTRTMHFPLGSEYKFSSSHYKGMHLVNVVKMDIEKSIKAGTLVLPENHVELKEKKLRTICFNEKALTSFVGKKLLSVDINSCYFNTAHNLKIITDRAYDLGFKKDKEYKHARNISIGCLGKKSRVLHYFNGKIIKDETTTSENAAFRLQIINHVFSVALKVISKVEKGFAFFLTDCFFILPEYKEKLDQALLQYGYVTKQDEIIITKVFKRSEITGGLKVIWEKADEPDIEKSHYFSKKHEIHSIDEYKPKKKK